MAKTLLARDRLRVFRESRDLTLRELAERIGCAPSHLLMIIKGSRSPGRKHAVSIEHVTGIEVSEWDRAS